MLVSYALAVLTAIANATANILMRKATREEPKELQFRLGLARDLARSPAWLGGFGVSLLSYPLGALALGTGQLAVVQPIMILELPMTLIAAAWTFGSRLGTRDWIGVAAMTVGLAGLIAFLLPHGGDPGTVTPPVWILASLVTAAIIGSLYALGRRSRMPEGRAAYLGASSGLTFGLGAAYTKSMTMEFSAGGLTGALTSWELYASVVAGTVAMWLLQNAYAAGRLAAAQPGVTLLDPALAILWGILVFHEQPRSGVFILLALLSGIAMAAGAIMLARSPQLHRVHGGEGRDDEAGRREPRPRSDL